VVNVAVYHLGEKAISSGGYAAWCVGNRSREGRQDTGVGRYNSLQPNSRIHFHPASKAG
jgi:hypothetical protein